MKRVLAFASALALAVGAIASAAFADDNVPAQIPLTDLYADPELYDLYVAPYYNNLSFQDWGDYATDAVISGFPMNTVKQIEATEGGLESLWNVVHDAFSFGYNIGQDWVSKLYVDTSDGRLKSDGNIMTDDLKALLDQYFKYNEESGITINGKKWVKVPATVVRWDGFNSTYNLTASTRGDVYITTIGTASSSFISAGVLVCSYSLHNSSNDPVGLTINSSYSGSYASGYYARIQNSNSYNYGIVSASGFTNSVYPNGQSDALADFFGYPIVDSSGGPTWNGDGYYRDEYNVDVALPAIPAIDWSDLSNKYYIEYGGDFVDGDVNNFYYDISYNYFPAEYTYTIPYWLIDGNTTVLDFDYSLELPTVELYELPSEFSGGEEVWDSSFTMLGGFGAFILLGFSFGLVALFFKD